MAEAELFSLATDILKLVGSITYKQIQLVCGARDELQTLQHIVETIQAVLLDAEKQQWHNLQVKLWLGRLNHVLYEVQDLLDDVATEDLRREVTYGNKMLKEVRVFFSKSNQLAHRLKVAKKIQKLRKKLDLIKNDKVFLQLEPHPSESNNIIVRRRTTHSFVLEEEIIGREEDKRKIIAHLFDSSSRESVSVVSIVGMGGLGKTALSQLVYNDDKVKDCFQLKMWVCHGNPEIFDVDLIIKEILKSAEDEFQKDPEMKGNLEGIETKSKDQLQRLLRKVLDGKKYLLVLDDLWNEDRQTWLELQLLLMGGAIGSKILVTTRNQSVVEAINVGAATHVLRGLSKDNSWDLFKKMAFGDGEELLDPRQEEIGRDVVKKCVGVPLAIRVIGSLLYGKKEIEWLRFKEHELSRIKKLDEGIIEVLKLSYDFLPSRLKRCFSYCALFPKGCLLRKHTVIQLWMAQGFIESLDGSESLEETGDSYILDLLHRSFLEVAKHDFDTGELVEVKMHDLMHDLALKVAGDECKMLNLEQDIIGGGVRHALFVLQSSSLQKVTSVLEATNLRTFFCLEKSGGTFEQNLSPREYDGIFSELRHCRALYLRFSDFCIPPSLGGRLKHLRFLDVSRNKSIKSLPDSITDLVNLQTFKLDECEKLTTLPRDLKKLINLRHLSIDKCFSLSHMPHGLNHLNSLHTLSMFVVQKIDHKVPGGVGRLDELGGLDRLAGSITLRKLEFLQPTLNTGHLKEKQFLRSLMLEWSDEQKDDKIKSNELVVWENLRPHQNLARLSISSYTGRSSPSWLSSIRNLASLFLSKCRGWRYLPPLSELSSLRVLHLKEMDELEFVQEISDEEQCDTARPFFPSLKILFLASCCKLEGWWGRRQLVVAEGDHQWYDSQSSFPKLVQASITNCPHLNSLPLFPQVEILDLDGVSAKLLEEQVMANPNCPSEGAGVSTFIPLSKLKRLQLDRVVDLEYSLLDTLLCRPSNLEFLDLTYCDKLRGLSRDMRFLSSLLFLHIHACEQFDWSSRDDKYSTQWHSLVKLCFLIIKQVSKLVILPDGIQHVITLQILEIKDCENLTRLPEWIGNLSSLQTLEIINCPGLTFLPDGMCRLTSLKKLRIAGCPTLEKRCQKESGADWETIAHVTCLSFELMPWDQI